MIKEKEIFEIYKSNGVDILDNTWAANPKKWSNISAKNASGHHLAAMQILGGEDQALKKYWSKIFLPMTTVFQRQLKNVDDRRYRSWDVNLVESLRYPETQAISLLGVASYREQALRALYANNAMAAERFGRGKTVVIAADGEMLGGLSIEPEINVVRPDTNIQRQRMSYEIIKWQNERYHQDKHPQCLIGTWMAGVGWSAIVASSQNLKHERTLILTNLFKNLSQAELYCDKFGWPYPGIEKIREATLAIYVAHEFMHETRDRDGMDELSSDIGAFACVIDLARKGLLGTVQVMDVTIAIFAEYATQAKEKPTDNLVLNEYGVSGRFTINLMYGSGLIVQKDQTLSLNMDRLDEFWQQVMKTDQIIEENGDLSIIPLPEQLLNML